MKGVISIILSVLKGAAKAVPVIGSISNEIKSNKASRVNGTDKVDKTRLISYLITSILIIIYFVCPDCINTELIASFF